MSRLTLELTAEAEKLILVRQAIEGVLDESVDRAFVHDVKLAVSEACSNVVKHAYAGSGPLTVELALDRELEIVVRDSGGWSMPSVELDPQSAGVGIALIRELADRCEIASSDSGTSVRMSFKVVRRAAQEPA
jgi:serine/threonine-protein kinase RsbW